MKRIVILAFLAICSCAVQKPTVQKDSVRVEIRERIVRDTVKVDLPPVIIEKETADTVSILESKFASSTAAIRRGLLYHSLSAGGSVQVPVYVTVHDTTTLTQQAQTVYVDVPRRPTKWESFLEVCGWILLALAALAIACLLLKIFLKI